MSKTKKKTNTSASSLLRKSCTVNLDTERVLVFGMKAHYFLLTEYGVTAGDISALGEKEGAVAMAKLLHAMFITEYPETTLDDIFTIMDSCTIEQLKDVVEKGLSTA